MAVVLDIHVPGIPQQQGSKTPWGSDANEAKLKPWRAAVQEAAKEAFTGTQLLREAVFLDVVYTYPRRKSHYRTGRNAHLLREDAPDFKTSAPDRDKLLRATQDALTGVVMYDDSYIVGGDTRKVWGVFADTHIVLRTVGSVEQVAPHQVGGPSLASELPVDVREDVGPPVDDVQPEPFGDPVGVAALFDFAEHTDVVLHDLPSDDVRAPVQRAVAPGSP